ncbi:hypothetical protein AVEN_105653-1 [Araneus ventricosus]|uniref:Uncharacterized protein n=1 Tax=Araneus ventricosus TaxID=182803 RepID=A0A4Y2QWW0_ARAVE|nr:hypothetical protein AVEN_105653-1 [Araneus ventricosus]
MNRAGYRVHFYDAWSIVHVLRITNKPSPRPALASGSNFNDRPLRLHRALWHPRYQRRLRKGYNFTFHRLSAKAFPQGLHRKAFYEPPVPSCVAPSGIVVTALAFKLYELGFDPRLGGI